MRIGKIIIKNVIFFMAISSMALNYSFAAGITVGSGASVTLSGSPTITTVDLNNSGTLTADAGTINISGNWAGTGIFNSGTSTLDVVGSGVSTIDNSNAFYNFRCAAASKLINFSGGQTQSVSGNFTLTGANGARISLRSTTSGTQWKLDPQGEVAVSFADVMDASNINASVITPSNSLDSGNNSGWVFGSLAFTSATQSLITGVESDPFDFNINYVNSNSAQRDIGVNLSSDSSGPFQFRAISGGPAVSLVTVPGGSTAGSFFYLDDHAGSPVLTISSRGYASAAQPTTVSGAVFTLAVSSPQVAGSPFTLTITAKDGSGGILTSYSGTVNLTVNYVAPASGTGVLGVTSTSAFVNGVAVITDETFSDCGTITIKATDANQAGSAGTSANIDFRPFDFSVTAGAQQTVSKPFDLTVIARNAQAVTCPNYSGDTVLSVNYVSPSVSQSGVLTVTTLGSANFINGTASLTTQAYNKWGTITITAADSILSSSKGVSVDINFAPQDFSISLSAPPPSRNFYYVNENFSATVEARDFNAAAISNYKGTVVFTGSGLSVPSDYTFSDTDAGSHLFDNINGASDISTILSASDTVFASVSGSSQVITVKSATINVISTSGSVGPLVVQVQILDSKGNVITSDNSTSFTVTIAEFVKNSSIVSKAVTNKVTVSQGSALISVTDSEAETVTITAIAEPSLVSVAGLVRFGTVSGGGIGVQYWREIQGAGLNQEISEEESGRG